MTTLMLLHILTGSVSVLAGATAIFAKKGSRLHKKAGMTFVFGMLLMALTGAFLALLKPMMISFLAGIFTCYLIATSWRTVTRKEGETGLDEIVAMLVALAIGIAGIFFGLEALNSDSGLKDGFSSEPYFFFAGLALIAAALDLNLLIKGGILVKVQGSHRLARHLWRMFFAFYIAVGSAFTQGAQAFPDWVSESPWISLPENIVALLMLFWLARVLLTSQLKRAKLKTCQILEKFKSLNN